jgi:hypothetical protein
MRLILFVFLLLPVPGIANDYFEVLFNSGDFKEDLKIYSTGLVKLKTSGFGGGCSHRGGEFRKRVKPKRLAKIFKLAKKLEEKGRHSHLDSNYSIKLKINKRMRVIDYTKNQKTLNLLNRELAFLRGELLPESSVHMVVKKINGNKVKVSLEQKGKKELKINFPQNINYLFHLDDRDIFVQEYQLDKTKNGYAIELTLSEKLPPGRQRMNMSTNYVAKFSNTPILNLCADL